MSVSSRRVGKRQVVLLGRGSRATAPPGEALACAQREAAGVSLRPGGWGVRAGRAVSHKKKPPKGPSPQDAGLAHLSDGAA